MPVTAVAAAALPPMVVATLPATAAKAGAASPPVAWFGFWTYLRNTVDADHCWGMLGEY